MSLVDYGRILIRRGWIIILMAIIGGVAAYLFSIQQTPVYRSTQKVLMNPSRSDNGLQIAIRNTLNSYVEFLDSDLRATDVIDRLSLDMTPGQLNSRTTMTTVPDSFLITIDADLEDGELANEITRTFAQVLQEEVQRRNQEARQEDRINAQLQDNAKYGLFSPRISINIAIGAIGGALLGAIIIFVLEYLESNMIRRREDLEQSVGLTVLATVPKSD